MVRLILPRAKRSWISWRTWSSNGLTSLGARIETSQKRWLTERTSAERRWPSRSISAEPYPVMLRIIPCALQEKGQGSGFPHCGSKTRPRSRARGLSECSQVAKTARAESVGLSRRIRLVGRQGSPSNEPEVHLFFVAPIKDGERLVRRERHQPNLQRIDEAAANPPSDPTFDELDFIRGTCGTSE